MVSKKEKDSNMSEVENLKENYQGFRCSFYDDNGEYIRGQINEIYERDGEIKVDISDINENNYCLNFYEIQKQTINDEPL